MPSTIKRPDTLVISFRIPVPASKREGVARALYYRLFDGPDLAEFFAAIPVMLRHRNVHVELV
jgi:hypothetical protein